MIVINKNAMTQGMGFFLLYVKFTNLWLSAQYFNQISKIKRTVGLKF